LNGKLNVLGIDDHPIVLDGYRFMFQNLDHGFDTLNFVKAYDCESAYNVINQDLVANLNLAVIDYSIPSFKEKNLYSGKDIAALLRDKAPQCKIIIMTMHKEIDIVFNIFSSINPEGFINKSDCTTDELMYGFKQVLEGNTFYSKVIGMYNNIIQKGIVLEDLDVSIIRFLARGVKNRDLSNYIPLTYPEIEKRIENIQAVLGVTGNEGLVKEARTQGYI
jgi:two-component system response regulator NreC